MQSDAPSSAEDGYHPYAEPAGEPCAEALLATRAAGEIARQLHESGRALRFSLTASAARVEVLLCDSDGTVLSHLTPARALEVAAGGRWRRR